VSNAADKTASTVSSAAARYINRQKDKAFGKLSIGDSTQDKDGREDTEIAADACTDSLLQLLLNRKDPGKKLQQE